MVRMAMMVKMEFMAMTVVLIITMMLFREATDDGEDGDDDDNGVDGDDDIYGLDNHNNALQRGWACAILPLCHPGNHRGLCF